MKAPWVALLSGAHHCPSFRFCTPPINANQSPPKVLAFMPSPRIPVVTHTKGLHRMIRTSRAKEGPTSIARKGIIVNSPCASGCKYQPHALRFTSQQASSAVFDRVTQD